MGKLTEESLDLTKVILIGDVNNNLLGSLLGSENSVLQEKNELLLDTKYYVARLKLVSLKTVEKIDEWKVSTPNTNIGAIVYNYDGEFRSIEQLKRQMSIWQAEIQVAVCKRLERSADWSENLYRFCAGEQIELVELDPDAETIEELNECHELYGVSRIWQILEAGNWSGKIMKMNPLGWNERDFEEIRLPYSGSAKKSSKDALDDEEFGSEDFDMTDEDKEMILKLFGGPKVSFDSLMKDVDVPDPAVAEYFKQETGKLRRQNKLAASKRRKKKKSKVTATNEFGEFVDASSSAQISNDGVMQNSSNVAGSTKDDHIDADVNMHDKKESSGGNCKDYPENSKKNSHELSSVSRSMIDGLFDKSIDKQGTTLANKIHAARSALLKMPFGPERQNLAADTMVAVIKSIGDSDLFISSSDDDEPHT
uniref:BZIP domain-containing protein n=1 Tax=Elaeophora elaphi TaxID=1147741 RepID=A0A0R3RGW0_9BILA